MDNKRSLSLVNKRKDASTSLINNNSVDGYNNIFKKKKQDNNLYRIGRKISYLRRLIQELERKQVCIIIIVNLYRT